MENPKENIPIEIAESKCGIMRFADLKDAPTKIPDFYIQRGRGEGIVINSLTHKVYCFLRDNPTQAFTPKEIYELVGAKTIKKCAVALNSLKTKEYIYSLGFKIPNLSRFGSFVYSYSQKSLYKRLLKETPKEIKKCLMLIEANPNSIFCIDDLVTSTGASRNAIFSWLYKIYYQRLNLIKVKRIQGIRTFLYNTSISDEEFDKLYDRYYRERVIEERNIASLGGREFEEFATWVFAEYMKLKGINIEFVKCDLEPVDFIGKAKLDISELLTEDKHNEFTLLQFVVSCKHRRFDRPLGSWYVMGFSGCLREGKSFRGQPIFEPRNSVGVILCTSATSKAYEACSNTGIRIFDIAKLLRMYDIVRKRTGQEHPLFEKICSRIEVYREMRKSRGNVNG